MLERERFLIVHGQSPERWADRWGIEPFSAECHVCDRLLTTTVPFACGTLRGLVAPECECGNELTPYCVVRDFRHGDLFTGAAC